MPCRDDGYPAPKTAEEFVKAHLLCEAMTLLEENHLLIFASDELRTWWATHQVKEDDRVRQEAAAKLTARERLALGIDSKGRETEAGMLKSTKPKKGRK